jgi:hypothetical protein
MRTGTDSSSFEASVWRSGSSEERLRQHVKMLRTHLEILHSLRAPDPVIRSAEQTLHEREQELLQYAPVR